MCPPLFLRPWVSETTGGSCPSTWKKATVSGVSLCQKLFDGTGCSSAIFPIHNFCPLSEGVVERISEGTSYWIHIWSNTMLMDCQLLMVPHVNTCRFRHNMLLAPMNQGVHVIYSTNVLSLFVGSNHYCESGRDGLSDNHSVYHFDDPLWDKADCLSSSCCTKSQPWFYRELGGTTTSDIEVRLCDSRSFAAGFTVIDQLEIYVQWHKLQHHPVFCVSFCQKSFKSWGSLQFCYFPHN